MDMMRGLRESSTAKTSMMTDLSTTNLFTMNLCIVNLCIVMFIMKMRDTHFMIGLLTIIIKRHLKNKQEPTSLS